MDDQSNPSEGGGDQGAMPTPAPVASEPQPAEKCTTCGNSASGGNCMPCGQGEISCTCTPAGGAPTGGSMPPPVGGEPAPVV